MKRYHVECRYDVLAPTVFNSNDRRIMASFSSADEVFSAMGAGLAADQSIKKKIKATI